MCVVNLEGGFEFCLEELKESRIRFAQSDEQSQNCRIVKDLRSLGHPEYLIQIAFVAVLPFGHMEKLLELVAVTTYLLRKCLRSFVHPESHIQIATRL